MKGLVLLVVLSIPVVACAVSLAAPTGWVVPLESFDQSPLLAFPEQWKARGDKDQARQIYRVAEEHGNRFLHAHAEQQAIQIGIEQVFQPREFPLLRWR